MIINKTDISEYSFGQQFSDMNGKTSNPAIIVTTGYLHLK